jgi:hypothetical protein
MPGNRGWLPWMDVWSERQGVDCDIQPEESAVIRPTDAMFESGSWS